LFATNEARADDVAGAAKAFSQAQQAMLDGDPASAADFYELADELSPSAPALRNAARARLAANHLATAATLAAELLRRYPSDTESRSVAEAILTKLTPELGQISVTCTPSCKVTVDGKAIFATAREQQAFFTQPGIREVTATFADGRQKIERLTSLVNHTTPVTMEPPPLPAPSPTTKPLAAASVTTSAVRPRSKGLPRTLAIVGGVVTAGLATGAIISGLSTLDTRDQIRAATAAGDMATANDLYNTGRDQQTRTNLLFGATAVVGAATIVVAFLTNWSGADRAPEVGLVPTSGGGSLVFSGHF
jgi:hypothetical protein